LFFGKQRAPTSSQKPRHVVVMADMGWHDGIPRALILAPNGVTIDE
jgi:hypothetical protein